MKWLAVRVACAGVFWFICSGCLSSSETSIWTSAPRGSFPQQDTAINNINVSDQVCLVGSGNGALSKDNEFYSSLLVHDIRGGDDSARPTDDFSRDDCNDTTMVDTKRINDQEDVLPLQQDKRNTRLSQKVSHKLKRWKEQRSLKRRLDFLDRMALVSDALLKKEHDAILDKEEEEEHVAATTTTHQSDLERPGRYFTIVTTAALPWMTGTAVNPLLRSAYLVKKTQKINNDAGQWVTLVVPWLELPEDQQELYGRVFESQQEQEDYIRTWLRQEAEMPDAADPDTGLKILFYPARYHGGLKSIFAMGDMCALINEKESDVCILEEPEHLNWYRAPGQGWTTKFHYVVGIVHTNYREYASGHYSGLWTAPAIQLLSSAMVRAYCHKVIKLSEVLQTFAPEKETISNVHGVRFEFLKEGLRRSQEASVENVSYDTTRPPKKVYFIGKLLWAKGLDLMLDLQKYYKSCTGDYFEIDIYGSGPEQKEIIRSFHGRRNNKQDSAQQEEEDSLEEESMLESSSDEDEEDSLSGKSILTVQRKTRERLQKIKDSIKATTESLEFDLPKSLHELRRQPIPATFPGRVDHALLKDYDVFVNPSVSEVLCTTTAEALAMGKFAIIPVHPSNTFFMQFPNCLAYRNKFEFVANLRWALTHDPEPLTPELAREFTWEAATDRFVRASAISHREALEREKLGLSKLDERIAWFHNELGKGVRGDALRKVLGGGPVSHQVKYQVAQQELLEAQEFIESDEEEEEDVDEDEGLPRKLRMSSFAEAIRSTVTNGLPSLKMGSE